MRILSTPLKKHLLVPILAIVFCFTAFSVKSQYTWTGITSNVYTLAANWNPARTSPASTDVLIFDGSLTSNPTITGVIGQTVGQIKLQNNVNVVLQSGAAAALVISGGTGTDLDIPLGSTLNLNSVNGISISFTGAQTASVAGTFTASSTGTGSINFTNCTASVAGTINNSNANFTFISSTSTLSFQGGSNFNHSAAATGATLPLATWDPASNLTITGIVATTAGFTNNAQTFGNVTWNCTSQTANTHNMFAGATAVIAGNLTIQSTGSTGRLRLLNGGNLTVSGALNVTGGNVDFMNGAATLAVTGNVAISGSSGVNFANGAGTTTIGGNVTISNSAIVNFGNAAAATVVTINGNLTYSSTGVSVVGFSTGSATLNILGNFSMGSGQFGIGSGTGAGTLRIGGTFSKTGGAFGMSGTATTNLLEFNGTTTQNVSFNSAIIGLVNVKLNNINGINLTSTLAINAGASLTISSGSITGTGTASYDASVSASPSFLIYNSTSNVQVATAQEFPSSNGPASLTINNTNAFPNNKVTLPFNRSLVSFGVLTLTSGILDNTGFIFSIPNTITGAIAGGSSASYIKGALVRNLPTSLATGSTYVFPVGKEGYNPFELVNPTTNSGGTVSVKAEVIDANTGGTPGNLMGSLNTSRYWAASITTGAGNFTNSFVRLNDTRGAQDGIAASATLAGIYDHIGGVVSGLTSTSITSTTPAITSIPGFFVMGNLAAATLSNLSITPAGNQCVNVARTVTVTVIPGAGAVTGVNLNYQVNGGSVLTVPMTNTSGNNWSALIPVVTPSNGTVTWSVTATDANSLSKTATGTTYTDEPLSGITAVAVASPTTVCSGSASSLSVSLVKTVTATLGAGASTSNAGTGSAAQVSPLLHYYGSVKSQYFVPASELVALGLGAGKIKALGLNVTNVDAFGLTGLTVSIAPTALNAQPATLITSGLVTVYSGTYTPVVGINTFTFNLSDFTWDGSSNIIIQFCWGNSNTGNGTGAHRVKFDATTYVANAFYRSDNLDAAASCAAISGDNDGTNNSRPQFIFTMNLTPTPTAYSWSDGTNAVGANNPQVVNPVNNTTYSSIVTAAGCTVQSNTVTVSTIALPNAPNANNSTQCGTGVPQAFVTTGFATGSTNDFRWYDTQTGGNLLQSGGGTYTGTISSTTHFWVSESNGTCESLRTDVQATVTQPDPINAIADNINPCLNTTIQLSVSDIASVPLNSYTYSWSSPEGAASGIIGTFSGVLIPVIPTAAGTFRYVVTATDGSCVTTDTVTITVKSLPVLNTPTVNPMAVCPGVATTLTANTVVTGTAIIGTGNLQNAASSTTATAYPAPFGNYYQGALNQMLITAAELTAAGLHAGNITGLSFDVVTPSTTALSGFNIGIKSSALAALSTLETGFTTVYSTSSYTPAATPGYSANTINFSIPFNWNGSSNIIIQTCFANSSFTTNAVFNQSATGYVSTLVYRADLATVCSSPGSVTFSYNQRPNIKFAGQVTGTGTLLYSWQPGASAGNVVAVNPDVTTTYTVTATNTSTSCSTTGTVTATVNPLPPVPSANNGTDQCGTGITDASVSSNSGEPNPVFNWYLVPTGGIAVQTGTSTTYNTPISATTTFYVSEISAAGCEGQRIEFSTIVSDPDALVVTATQPNICIGGSTDISSLYTPNFNSYGSFTLTASPATGSGITNPLTLTVNGTNDGSEAITVTPATAGVYTYTITANDPDKGCQTSSNVVVTVSNYPVITGVSASSATTCPGGAVTLTGTTNTYAAGTVTIGTASTLTGAIVQPTAFCNRWAQYWSQTVYTAAELNTAGLSAGNITALTYTISTLGDAATNANFTIKIGTTAGATVTGLVTTGLTNVYGPATYTHAVGANTITFDTPFAWDGVSNLLIDIRHDGVDLTNNARTFFTATAGNTTATATTSTSSATQPLASSNPTAVLSTSRLNINFAGQVATPGPGNYNWTWNPGSVQGSIVTVNPLSTTAYTATAADPVTGCSTTSSPVTVTVSPVTASASANPSTAVCAGAQVVLSAVPGGGAPFSYSWSNGVSVIGTTQSLNINPTSTTTYTVTVTDGCGNSTTASVTVTVNPLPTASIAQAGPIIICAPATQVLNAVTNAGSASYQWQLNGVNIQGATASAYSVTSSGSYTVIVTATATGCISAVSSAVAVTINLQPGPVSITASSTTLCNGIISTLNGTVGTSSATIGSGTSTSVGNTTASTLGPNPFQNYYGGTKQQMVYLASELSALGMGNGSVISALRFNLATADNSLALVNLRIKMKNSTTSSLTGTWEAGMIIVRAASNYTPVAGINTIPLTTNFTWDGISNLVIEVNYSNNNAGTTGSVFNTAKYSPTSFSSTIFYRVDSETPATLNSYTGAVSFSYNSRNDITFDFSNPGTIKWSPITGLYTNAGATTAYTGTVAATVFAKPSVTTTYTATATSTSGCTSNSSVQINVNPRPTAVLTGGGTYCNAANTATILSIAVTGAGPWSGTLSNGAVFSGSVSPISVTVTPAVTTTYNIATLVGSQCSSIPADLSGSSTVTINPRPTGTLSGSGVYCNGASTTTVLSIAVTGAGPWNGSLSDGTLFSGSASPISVLVTPASTTTYTIATLNGSQCSSIPAHLSGTSTVTVNPRPTGVLSGAAAICDGSSTTSTFSIAVTGTGPWNGTLSPGAIPFSGTTSPISVTVPASASLTTYTIATLNGALCSAIAADLSGSATVSITPRPTGVISGNAIYPTPTTTPLSIAVTGTGPWSGTLNPGAIPFSGNSSPIIVNVTPTNTTTYTIATLNGTGCSSIAADLSGSATITIVTLTAPGVSVVHPTCALATGTITVTSPLGAAGGYSIGGPYQPSNVFSGVTPGPYSVTFKDENGFTSPATAVTVDPQPFAPGTPVITGVTNVCPYLGTAQTQTYTAAVTGNGTLTYTWTLPPNVNLVAGGGTNSPNNFVTVTFNTALASVSPPQPNKQIRVTAQNSCGISPIGVFYLATQAPVTPGPITGPTNVCALIGTANTATYTINSVLAATGYSWSVPSNASFTSLNDTSIVVTFPAGFTGGVVSVAATNNCGANAVRTLTIVNAPPSTPALIAGPTNVCANIAPGGTAATYSVAAVTFATSYTWTAPAGAIVTHPNGAGANDNTITVLFPTGFVSGTITVTATNGCGTSGVRSLSVSKLNPSTPSVIDVIQTAFCEDAGGRVFTYTLASMPANATSVLWTIPAVGATIVSGQGTTSLTVGYTNDAVNGAVTAQGVNNCGISSVRSTTVKLPSCPTEFAGGNNGASNNTTTKGDMPAPVAKAMEVKIFPNPSVSDFKLEVLTSRSEEINVRVLDNLGRLYKSLKVMPYQTIALGTELKAGSYFIEVRQGTEVKTTKVIKF